MNAREIKPTLAAALRSLAESQLQAQAAHSAALDAGAVGVMSVDAAIAAIFVTARFDDHLWVVSLTALSVSFGLAMRVALLGGAKEIGPLVAGILDDRRNYADDQLEQWLLEDLAGEVLINRGALARKMPQLTGALVFAALAIVLGLAGLVS